MWATVSVGCNSVGKRKRELCASDANAASVTLVLYSEEDFKNGKITAEIDLDPESGFRTERTKDEAVIWHVEVPNLSEKCLYGYRVNGPKLPGHGFDFNKVVLDPYAKHVCCNREGYGKTNKLAETDLERNWPQYASGVPALYSSRTRSIGKASSRRSTISPI